LRMIAAFERTHDPTAGVHVGDLLHRFGECAEVFGLEFE
jgi:hypothetical protein